MKFDFIIGNPPYQDEAIGENTTFAPPIYHKFLDAAYGIAERVELIHPARFLFNAGNTPKHWNKKILNDPHFKVLMYQPDANKVFPNTSINGGIAISYHDMDKKFGAIGTFTAYSELNSILIKIKNSKGFKSLEAHVITRTAYRLTNKMHEDHPEAIGQLSKGHAYDMASNIFEKVPQVFHAFEPDDKNDYIRILGRENNNRTYKYIRRNYVNDVANMYKYKVIMAGADGAAGSIGNPIPARICGAPSVEYPRTGTTESFISIGCFDSEEIANNALKYIKTKFARTLLSILKVTQAITPEKWAYVPLQDFTQTSDIDWTASIPDIDKQLYAKYGLDETEIEFIETHVKEMQ